MYNVSVCLSAKSNINSVHKRKVRDSHTFWQDHYMYHPCSSDVKKTFLSFHDTERDKNATI